MSTSEKQDVDHPVVYKVIGAPGTGKTTRVVGNPELGLDGLFVEHLDEYSLFDQMLVTYTNAGVDEAADRLEEMLDAPRYKIDKRVTTIHGQCFRALGLDREQTVDHWKQKDFCDIHDLEFGWDDEDDDIMAADKNEGNALFDLYGWLQSNCMELEEWQSCPQDWTGDEDPLWLMEQWEAFKAERNYVGFGDMIEGVVETGYKQLENLGYGVLFPDEETTNMEMFKEARHDPNRDPSVLRGKGAFVDAKVLYVDEVQDLTPLQWRWYLLQKLAVEKVFIGGDDDQCLPPNSQVTCRVPPLETDSYQEEQVKKPISEVERGDEVKTMLGDGDVGFGEVSDILERKVNGQTFNEFTTHSGETITVTDNHRMFTRVPDADESTVTDCHYVYLMRDDKMRFRIGETDDLRRRLNGERNARCIIPLEAVDTREEALLKELEYSLKYSIPTITFTQRNGEVLSSEDNKKELYRRIDHECEQLAHDLNVNEMHPPLFKKATTRGRTASTNVNFKMCSDNRGDEMLHKLEVHTRNEDTIQELRRFDEFNVSEKSSGSVRFRVVSPDFSELGSLGAEVATEVNGDLVTQMQVENSRRKSTVVPAKNIVEGMLLPVEKDGEVVWDEVVDVKEYEDSTTVYDLTVEGSHNFEADGVFSHNTIYGWAGANPDFMLNEEGEFEVLEKTYRIPREIWTTCDNVIQHVDHRQPKTVEPEGDGGEVVTIKRPSSRQLMEYLEDGECMVLFRARYQIDEFRNDLHEYGIPYRNMSTYDTWSEDMVKLRDALAKIDKQEGSIKGDELEILLEYADDHMVNDGNGVNKSETVMGQLGGISFDRLNEVFDLKVYGSDPTFKASTYLRETDEVNYYEKQAVVGCLNAGNYDMDPDRVRIGTIHSAKGKEAETVLLSTDSTKTILENMDTGAHADGGRMSAGLTVPQSPQGISDAERRVYYVGMTRASEQLILAEGVTDAECVIPIDALIGEDGRDDTTQGGQDTFSANW